MHHRKTMIYLGVREREGSNPLGKISRARGGCLGTGSLRRTRQAAKSRGEPHRGLDPRMSERANPARFMPRRPPAEHIGRGEGTGGTETSKYPEEEKPNGMPGVAASETGRRPNRRAQRALGRRAGGVAGRAEGGPKTLPGSEKGGGQPNGLGRPAAQGYSPVGEAPLPPGARSRVPPGTWNPAGSRGDHPPSLNTSL